MITSSMLTEQSSDYNYWTPQQWQAVKKAYWSDRSHLKLHAVLKRVFDAISASVGIVLISPLLVLIAIAIKATSPGPICFCQQRLGQSGQTFKIYKFRTMVDGAVNIGAGLDCFKGDPRITTVGKFLREYHLDELPQLINVLKGEMSLVGPRPLLPQELPTYSDRQKHRLLVPPGMTAWEAVKGGLDNRREERIELDLWYVEHWNFWLDLLILALTVPVVLRREGVYEKKPS